MPWPSAPIGVKSEEFVQGQPSRDVGEGLIFRMVEKRVTGPSLVDLHDEG